MTQQSIEAYLGLLDIRLRAARRNARITGSIFAIGLALFFVLGMIGSLQGLEVFVVSALLVLLGFSFISTLIRTEALKAVQDFARTLLRAR